VDTVAVGLIAVGIVIACVGVVNILVVGVAVVDGDTVSLVVFITLRHRLYF